MRDDRCRMSDENNVRTEKEQCRLPDGRQVGTEY